MLRALRDMSQILRLWQLTPNIAMAIYPELFDRPAICCGRHMPTTALGFINEAVSACCSKYGQSLSELADTLSEEDLITIASSKTRYEFDYGGMAWLVQKSLRHDPLISRQHAHPRRWRPARAHPDGTKKCSDDYELWWGLNECLRLQCV